MDICKTEEGLYEVEIKGDKYAFEKWNADESLDVLLDIVPLVGKPLGAATAALTGGDVSLLDKEVNPQAIAAIIEGLTSNFNKATVKRLIIKLCSEKAFCNDKKISFKDHYEGKVTLIFIVAKANLEVQYGNFFDAIQDVLPAARMAGIRNAQPAT